jgi:hypothetical protein
MTLEILLSALKTDLATMLRNAAADGIEEYMRCHPQAQLPVAPLLPVQEVKLPQERPAGKRRFRAHVPQAEIDEAVARIRAGARPVDMAEKLEVTRSAVYLWMKKAAKREPKPAAAPEPQSWKPPTWKLLKDVEPNHEPPESTFDLEELLPLTGEQIRNERVSRNLNQRQPGEMLGLSQPAVSGRTCWQYPTIRSDRVPQADGREHRPLARPARR